MWTRIPTHPDLGDTTCHTFTWPDPRSVMKWAETSQLRRRGLLSRSNGVFQHVAIICANTPSSPQLGRTNYHDTCPGVIANTDSIFLTISTHIGQHWVMLSLSCGTLAQTFIAQFRITVLTPILPTPINYSKYLSLVKKFLCWPDCHQLWELLEIFWWLVSGAEIISSLCCW